MAKFWVAVNHYIHSHIGLYIYTVRLIRLINKTKIHIHFSHPKQHQERNDHMFFYLREVWSFAALLLKSSQMMVLPYKHFKNNNLSSIRSITKRFIQILAAKKDKAHKDVYLKDFQKVYNL